jgi:uncharacterized membrane protein
MLLEVTAVHLAWSFDLTWSRTILQVIWALGGAMVALSALVFLPVEVIAILGCVLIAGHNAFDSVQSTSPVWSLLHHRAKIPLGSGRTIWVVYPIVPWVGVMACGYALGIRLARGERSGLVPAGVVLIALFVALRASGFYGDPHPFSLQSTATKSVLAFLNCEKYPPSLDYLLMTLGPLLIALGAFSGKAPAWAGPLVVLGRVPLFYYVAHLYLLHTAAVAVFGISGRRSLTLGGVWLVWCLAVVALYPACRWFAGVKRRNPEVGWLSYL